MAKSVIDVSSHNGSIDWSKVKIDGVMIRLGYRGYGQGTLEMDKQFLANIRGCVTHDIPFGVYWFSTAINDKEGREEAEFVLKNISSYSLSLPIIIDSEYSNISRSGRSDSLSKTVRTSAVRAFCERIKEAGLVPGVYASESWFKSNLDASSLPYFIWCAKYSASKPVYPMTINAWQYTSSGTIAGINTKVDFSYWYSEFTSKQNISKKAITPVDYLQTDSRWKSIRYGIKDETSTIGTAGCGPTCAAMVIAGIADSSVTPATTSKWALDNGYKAYHQGTYYSYFVPQFAKYGIKCNQLNSSTVYHGANLANSVNATAFNAVRLGHWVVVCMGKGDWTSSGHFILWYGLDGDDALIFDPNSTKASRRKAPVAKMQYQAKYYWLVEVPKGDAAEEDDMTKEEVLQIIKDWYYEEGLKKPAKDATPALDWAYENGIMKDGAYERPATRTDVARVAKRLYDILSKK